jgi:FixJ family two-component response regulator
MSSSRQRSTANGTQTQEAQRPRLLIADDQPAILDALEMLLRPEGYRLDRAASPRQVIESLASESYEAVLMDMNYTRDTTSGAEGIDLLAEIQSYGLRVPIIVMTAWSSVELAVEAMRRGAADFIQKPWDNARLLTVLRTQLDLHRVQRQADMLEAENRFLRAEGLPTLIAESRAMQSVLEMIARIGPSDANVLITGEHGTGKEVVAQTLHMLSPRAPRSLVAVNTGALPEGTFESEIFGHVKGAFTDARTDRIGRFELADHGTLFLDEIANVPLRQQAKLLSPGPALPSQHRGDPPAASARTPRGRAAPGGPFPRALEQAVSPPALRLRPPRAGDDDAICVARQRARTGPLRRTCGADGAYRKGRYRRSQPDAATFGHNLVQPR